VDCLKILQVSASYASCWKSNARGRERDQGGRGVETTKLVCVCCLLLGLVNDSLSTALVTQRQERLVWWPAGLTCRPIVRVSLPSILEKVDRTLKQNT
jgi:hypothetical protein